MKFFLLLSVAFLVANLACGKADQSDLSAAQSDSLTQYVKDVVQEKMRIEELKESFEKNGYNQALKKYRPIIRKYAKRYGFDWRLIVAQIIQESRFREKARSPVGARGLMQLMPRTAKEITRELDVEYIFINPRENIAAGIYHLKKQYNFFPNADEVNRTKLGLASYNCGAGRVFDAQDIARYYEKSPYIWPNVSTYLTRLQASDWEMHLQVWPQGKPKHGYFYGFEETTNYVDNIWSMYQLYRKIL